MLQIRKNHLEHYLKRASFLQHGDCIEREHGALISEFFPQCEEFWKAFVVPLTNRVLGYPNTILTDINPRSDIDARLAHIANLHYSMFLNLVFARRHMLENQVSPLESVYVHLGAACDLAEAILAKWFILLQRCRGKCVRTLEKMSKNEFLLIVDHWYVAKYENYHRLFCDNGKPGPIFLPLGENLLKEYFGESSKALSDYYRTAARIREFRNVIVHDLKIARIVNEKGQYLVPRSSRIQRYRSWEHVAQAANDRKKIIEDFIPILELCKQDWSDLLSRLNSLWGILVKDFRKEFLSGERCVLTGLFGITFAAKPTTILSTENGGSGSSEPPTAPGTYHGGTADISGYRET